MNHRVLSVIGAVSVIATVWAADDPVAEAKEGFSAWVNSLNLSRQASFKRDGSIQNKNGQLNLSLQFDCGKALGYTDLVIGKVVTNEGEELDLRENYNYNRESYHNPGNHNQNLSTYLYFDQPRRKISGIKSFTGSLKLILPTGKLKKVTLDPIGKWLDTEADIGGTGSTVKVEKYEKSDDKYKFTFDKDMYGLIQNVTFRSESGAEIDTRSYGYGASNNACYYTFYGSKGIGEDAKATIYFYGGKQEVEVPIELEAIPFPGPKPKKDKPDVEVLEVEDADAEDAEDPGDDGVEEVPAIDPARVEF